MLLLILAIIFAIAGISGIILKTVDGDIPVRAAGIIAIIIASLMLIFSSVTVIEPGKTGVPVTFGSTGSPIEPGINIVAPWTDVIEFSCRTEDFTMTHESDEGDKNGDDSVAVQTSDNVTAPVDVTILYRLTCSEATNVYTDLGSHWEDKLFRPIARSAVRDAGARYDAVSIGASKREEFANDVKARIESGLEKYNIIVEEVKIRDIGLPDSIREAVEAKASAQQNAEGRKFALDAARQDAEIARTKAQADADSQQILACGADRVTDDDGKINVIPKTGGKCDQSQLTDRFLQLQMIAALRAIAASPNNSTVVVPYDSNTLLNLLPGNAK